MIKEIRGIKTYMVPFSPKIGDIIWNLQEIKKHIRKGENADCKLIIFPELAICGYPPQDLLLNKSFIKSCEDQKWEIYKSIRQHTTVVIGMPEYGHEGSYNSAFIIQKDGIVTYRKMLLPNYDVFDEKRYFKAGKNTCTFNIDETTFGITVCEDMWNLSGINEKEHGTVDPVFKYVGSGVDVLINISASPYTNKKIQERSVILKNIQKLYNMDVLYVNQYGAYDELVFDGQCTAILGENIVTNFTDKENTTRFVNKDALVLGIRDYVNRAGFEKVVLGLSGGIDSAVTACLAVEALGAENVIGITMPSKYSTSESVSESVELANNLGMECKELTIKDIYTTITDTFENVYIKPEGIADENIQARIRGLLLMTYSNQFPAMLLSTGNKSEMSIGYCVRDDQYIYTDNGMLQAKDVMKCGTNTIKNNMITHMLPSTKKLTYKLKTEIGTEIYVSEDHPVKYLNNQEWEYKKANEFSVGDIVPISCGENIFPENNAEINFMFEQKYWDFKSVDIELPKNINNHFAKFIGICVADGSYRTGGYTITTTKEEVFNFCVCFCNTYKIPFKTNVTKEGIIRFNIFNVKFRMFLKHIGVGTYSHNKTVPNVILKSSKAVNESFLSGLFMDSSTNNSTDELSAITYNTVHKKLAIQVQLILMNLGVFCYYKNKKTYHQVYIPSIESENLYEIGILKEKINKKIRSNVKNRIKTKSAFDLLYNCKEEIKLLIKGVGWKDKRRLRRQLSSKGASRHILNDYIDNMEDELIAKITEPIKQVKIKSIDIIEEDTKMYDFSVDNDHEFTVNGIYTHNCTLYGDMAGGLNVLGDVLKMEVYHIAKEYYSDMIPNNTMKKEPSAELAPDQKDIDSLPPYPVLDKLITMYIEKGLTKKQIYGTMDKDLVDKIINMIDRNEYKRRQSPPIIKIRQLSYGIGRRYMINCKHV